LKLGEKLKSKRIAAVDYGKRRIGIAICDILHITVMPKLLIDTKREDKFKKIVQFIKDEGVNALVVGIPVRDDNKNKEFIDEIKNFIEELKEISGLNVYEQDESYSTVEAVNTMINIGYGKKKRREKGNKDKIAAAIILRNFLESIE
jgi:putative Holliday junction resolvase